MRYWWVNQNQTQAQEHAGGYIWSPVRKQNGARNPFYDYMREVAPGDLIFCFWRQHVGALGVALSYCFDAPKPTEFGAKGSYWEAFGHRISVRYLPIPNPFRPKAYLDHLRPFLPQKHSPIRPETGDGLQSVYLTEIGESLAMQLLGIGRLRMDGVQLERASLLSRSVDFDGTLVTRQIEDSQVESVCADLSLDATVRESIIDARRGQGEFRRRVLDLERGCRVSRIRDPAHLYASHIKPWRSCSTADERLDGNNGLALAPHVDHLFDRGFLSFKLNGELVLSPLVAEDVLRAFHIDGGERVGAFRDDQALYLEYHRLHVLRRVV